MQRAKLLTDKICDDYNAHGFLIIENFLDDDEIIALRKSIDSIQSRVDLLGEELKKEIIFEKDLPSKMRNGISAHDVGNSIFIIGDPCKFDLVFEVLLNKLQLFQISSSILQTKKLIYHFMNITIKQAHFGRAIAMHRDYPNEYICTKKSDFFRVMLCLDLMTEHNGGTQYIPQTHLISDEEARLDKKENPDLKGDVKTIKCSKGSAVIIHPKLIHGGEMNYSNKPRRNIVIQIGDATQELVTSNLESVTGRILK